MLRRSLISIILSAVLIISLFNGISVEAAESKKVLNVNWSNIAAVGNQAEHSEACGCFCLAYCRTLLDNRVRYWYEFDANGLGNQYNCAAS